MNIGTRIYLFFALGIIAPLFYAYDFTIRVIPSVLAEPLMHTFHMTHTELGFHASLFLWGYALFQIPAGIIIDRFGSKRTLFLSCLVCGITTIIFACSQHLLTLNLSRILIGISASFAYVGALRATANYLQEKHFATYAAYVQIFGCIGAIFGGWPFATMLNSLHWRAACVVLGLIGVLIAGLILLFLSPINTKPQLTTASTLTQSTAKAFFSKRQLCAAAAFAFCIWTPVTTFAGLWGIPFIEKFYHVSTLVAASTIAAMWAGITVGGPVLGLWSSFQERRKPPMIISAVIGAVAGTIVIFIHLPSLLWVSLFLVILGACCSSQALSFGLVIDSQPSSSLGTSSAIVNTATIAGGVILQPLIGFLLDKQTRTDLLHHLHPHIIHYYQLGLSSIPIVLGVAVIISIFFVKETYCQKQILE